MRLAWSANAICDHDDELEGLRGYETTINKFAHCLLLREHDVSMERLIHAQDYELPSATTSSPYRRYGSGRIHRDVLGYTHGVVRGLTGEVEPHFSQHGGAYVARETGHTRELLLSDPRESEDATEPR